MTNESTSSQIRQAAAALGRFERRTGTRRADGVRRVDDLDGWARVLGEGIRQAEVQP